MKTRNTLFFIYKMIRYNLRITFSGRFIYFLLGALLFYLGITVIYALSEPNAAISDQFGILLFPGMLLVFYPAAFGIQNDMDARTLEMLFGVPNYRFKVWIVRFGLIFLISILFVYLFTWITSYLVIDLPNLRMTYHLMFPILLIGSLCFMFSTIVRSGNGTAVVIIIFSLFFLILSDNLHNSKFNVFLNPFDIPSDLNELAWASVVLNNRLMLFAASVFALMTGLLNLQKREKFMKG